MTSDAIMQSVFARLEKVERENRRIKRVGLAVLLFASLTVLMGQARSPRTIEAEQFVLRDVHGRERLAIGTPKVSGATGLGTDEPAIWLVDEKGQDRAILNSDGLRFADEKERPASEFDSGNTPRLILRSADGKVLWSAPRDSVCYFFMGRSFDPCATRRTTSRTKI